MSQPDRPNCPTCGTRVSRVTHTIGEVVFAEPCSCPVAYTFQPDGTALLTAVTDEPVAVRSCRVLMADLPSVPAEAAAAA